MSAPELAAVAEVLGTLSVRVGASRTMSSGTPERGRGDLEHLGVQALAHLGAAVVDQHRAVLVDVHQRAGLVERGQVERDAELHRRHRQGPLGVRVRGVERGDLAPARRSTSAGLEDLVPDRARAVRRAAPAARTAWAGPARRSCGAAARRRHPEQRRAPAEDVLDDDHALRAAEPAERGLRRLVGLADPPVHLDVRDPVGVVDVAQRAGQHRLGQVQAPPAVAGQRRLERLDPVVLVEADLPGGVERVPLAGHRDVLGAVQPQQHRPAGDRGAERGDRGEAVRLHLLAAETAAHPQALHGDLVAGQAQHVRDDLLGLRRVLGAGLHEHLPGLVDRRQRGVGLQVEVLLAAELELAAEPCARAGPPGLGVAAAQRRAALVALRRDRLGDVTSDGSGSYSTSTASRPAGPPPAIAEHPAHGVAVNITSSGTAARRA